MSTHKIHGLVAKITVNPRKKEVLINSVVYLILVIVGRCFVFDPIYLMIEIFKIYFYHFPGALEEGKLSSPSGDGSVPQAAVSMDALFLLMLFRLRTKLLPPIENKCR
jgi:hypothetical protein